MREVRDAWRSLCSSPVASITAVVALGLGIGATTTMFSLLSALALRALPVANPEQLVAVSSAPTQAYSYFRRAVFDELTRREILPHSFAFYSTRFNTSAAGEKNFVEVLVGSGDMFRVLGVVPHIGRVFSAADAEEGAEAVAVLSYEFWRSRYHADPAALGQTIFLEGRHHTIVGVGPRRFRGLSVAIPFEVAIPLGIDDRNAFIAIMARLTDGKATVMGRLRAVQPQIRDATNPYTASPYREDYLNNPLSLEDASTGVSSFRTRYELPLKVLLATAGLVLLVACGSVSTLMVSSAIRRERELTIKAALGASRRRLLSHQLLETGLLAVGGISLGLVVAVQAHQLLLSAVSSQAYTLELPFADWPVFAFCTMTGCVALVISAIAPVWRVGRIDGLSIMRGITQTRFAGFDASTIMTAVQVAASVLLIALTALFARTVANIASIKTGFETDQVLIATLDPPQHETIDRRRLLHDRIADALGALPSAAGVGLSLAVPAGNSAFTPWLELADGTKLPNGMRGVLANAVSIGWFNTMGTRAVEGRLFERRDAPGNVRVAVVNRAFENRHLQGRSALGETLYVREPGPDGARQPVQVVGVVEDAIYVALKEAPPATIYMPLSQYDPDTALGEGALSRLSVFVSVRVNPASPLASSRDVAQALSSVDPTLKFSFRTLADQIGAQYAQERLVAGVSLFFGTLSLLLAGTALYGVVATVVAARRREVAIRIAVGARRRNVLATVLARPTLAVGVGMVTGLALFAAGSRVIQNLLFQVNRDDPEALVWSVLALLLTVFVACVGPATRAVRTDPATTLRQV